MARIPTADADATLGNRIAEPQRGVLPADLAGAGFGRVVERVGTAGLQIEAERQERLDAVQRKALADQMQREREAKRAKAIATEARTSNELLDLSDEIDRGLADGTVDKTKASELYRERSSAIVTAGLESIDDDDDKAIVSARLIDNVGRGERGVRGAVDRRNAADIKSGVVSHIEEMQRYAARGPAEADEAIRNVSTFVQSVAGQIGLDGQKTSQAFAENVRFRQASDLVQANPAEALKVLRNKDTFKELDPDRRAALIASADSALLRAQERARIEAERLARQQERVFQGAASVFESGRAFSPAFGQQVLSQLRGSPYEAAVREMMATGPQNVAAATMPVEQQRAQLDGMLARANTEGSSPALNKEIDRRQKVLAAAERDLKEDALGAALERGVIRELPPLNIADIGSLPAALAQRIAAAQTASTWSGQPVSPLRPAEARQLSQVLAPMPPDQKSAALASIGSVLGDRDQIAALARQLDGQDKLLATAMMYANTATQNRNTFLGFSYGQPQQGRLVSEIILKGQQAQKDGRVKVDTAKETGWRAAIATEIGDAYPDQELRGRMIDAAMAITIGLASEGGSPNIEQAVRFATGGVRTQSDDSRVPLPYGWSENDLEDALKKYPVDRLPEQMRAGPAPITRDQFLQQLPDAVLVYAGQGRYSVRAGGALVTDAAGRRVVLDMRR